MKPFILVEAFYEGCPPFGTYIIAKDEEELRDIVARLDVRGEKGSSPPCIDSLECYMVEPGDATPTVTGDVLAGSLQAIGEGTAGGYNVLYKDIANCWNTSLWMDSPDDPLLQSTIAQCVARGDEYYLIKRKEDASVIRHN